MDARAEGDVAVERAVEHHRVGVLEDLGVAVGGGEVHEHLVARRHRAAGVDDVLGDLPRHGDRRVRPEQLLDGEGPDRGVRHHALAVLVVGGQVPEGGPDGAPRGVHTGDQHERGDPEHDGRVDQLAVHLGVEQLAQEVVAGLVLATPDLGDEEVDEPRAPLFAPNRVVGELEHVAHPAGEGVGQLGGDAQDVGDHPDRDLLRVVRRSIGAALGEEAVEQPIAQVPRHLLVGLDPSVGEPWEEQPACPRVQRRVRGDGRQTVGQHGIGLDPLLAGDGDHRDLP